LLTLLYLQVTLHFSIYLYAYISISQPIIISGKLKTLAAALGAANLIATMKSAGPFTVFAPTDEAFAKLPEGAVDALLKDKNKLSAILTYHVLGGSVPASMVVTLNGKDVKTVNGMYRSFT
jgi:uncharacterized surface protein with fasciclin (FAS1) repeats